MQKQEKTSINEERDWLPQVDDEVVCRVFNEIYEVAYTPYRGDRLKSSQFDLDVRNNSIGRIFRMISKFTPMGGINVSPEEDFDTTNTPSRGMLWKIEKSEVCGPVYYPFIFNEEKACKELRQRLVDGEVLDELEKEYKFSDRQFRTHARCKCDCDHGYEVEYCAGTKTWSEV